MAAHKVHHRHPTAQWLAQQIVEAFPWGTAPTYLVRDNDGAYGQAFTSRIRAMGIRHRPISPRSPWQNPYAEWLIGTLRRECLDHVLIVGEQHLRRMLASYSSSYYNESPRTWRWRRMGRSASYPEVRSDHHHANSFRTAPSLCFQSQGIHWKYEPKAAILFALILLGDDDGSGHCEVVQSNEGLWIHSAARWRRQRCVRTHQRSRTRRSEFTQRRTDR